MCGIVAGRITMCSPVAYYLVRVHGNAEEAGVGVDQLVDVSDPQVPEDRGVVEVGQIGHVLAAVELGRVDLTDQVLLEDLLLAALDLDRHFLALRALDETLGEAARGLVGHPAGLLRIIRLRLDRKIVQNICAIFD